MWFVGGRAGRVGGGGGGVVGGCGGGWGGGYKSVYCKVFFSDKACDSFVCREGIIRHEVQYHCFHHFCLSVV